MRVLLIMPWVRLGGAELISVKTALHLQKEKHEVRLVCLFSDTSQMNSEARKIKYVTCNWLFCKLSKGNKFLLYFLGPLVLFGLVLKESFWAEILFPHSLPAYWVASIIGKISKKKVVWLCNEPPRKRGFREVPLLDFLGWRIADSIIDRILVRRMDKVIVYSQIIKKEVKLRYKKNAHVVRLGVDYDFFSRDDSKIEENLRKKYGLFDKFIILMVGKLHPQKNQRLAVKVLAKIKPKIKNAVLVLVGEGPDKEKLENESKKLKIEKSVIFAGLCNPKIVRAWYGVCSLVLFPSVGQTKIAAQSFGFVPFEALCKKRVSIVSAKSGASEILGREKISLVCKPNIYDVSEAVIDFYKKNLYSKMGEKGKTFVKNNLTWERWGRETSNILFSTLQKRDIN